AIKNNTLYCKNDAYGIEFSPGADNITYKNLEIRNNVFKNEIDNDSVWGLVGQSGLIQTSLLANDNINGSTWTQRTAAGGFSDFFFEIAHDGSDLWCAVGQSGEIQTSPDGTAWTQRTADASYSDNFRGIAHDGSGLWVAVGESGEIQTSPNGTTWTSQTSGHSSAIYSVVFPPSAPIYIGEKYEDGYSVFGQVSIVENQFDKPNIGIGKILFNSHLFSMTNLIFSQNIGEPRLDLTGLDGYMTETSITNNVLGSASIGDFSRSAFDGNIVKGNVTFSGLDKSSFCNNYVGGFFTSPSIIRTSMLGNYIANTDLEQSTSLHVWDGYISADGPNVYINDNLLPKTTGQELGSRNNRWDGYFTRLDIGDATTVITDGYISTSNRDLEISAGLDNINVYSKVVHQGAAIDNTVTLDNGEVQLTSTNGTTVLKDGYLEAEGEGVNLDISAGLDNVNIYSKVIQHGPAAGYNSRVTIDNGEVQLTGKKGITVLKDGYLEAEGEGVNLDISAGANNIK
ncbi:hypothetical protein LCGC14_2464130, partial [marine sediment metagenome]